MKSSMNKTFKKELFYHINGIVLITALNALVKTNLIDIMIGKGSFNIRDISNDKKINEGYFNVTLRLLRSMGLIDFQDKQSELDNIYTINYKLNEIMTYKNEIEQISKINYFHINFNNLSNIDIDNYYKTVEKSIELLKRTDNKNLFFNGILIGPLLSNLGFYKKLTIDPNGRINFIDLHENMENCIIKLFNHFQITSSKNNKITEKGKFFLDRMSAYGVTSSYLPMLNRANDLLIGDCEFIWDRDHNNHELHINRSMNVWGSGGAHKTYFKKIDNLFKETFNQKIIDQPIGIIDIGCGDGTFLEHAYHVIINKTARKKYLDTHPLIMVGTDINKAARIISRKRLNKSNINNVIINGNIGNPLEINNLLKKEFNYNLIDFLNTRTFLDHNRIFEVPKKISHKNINTSGSFCYKGKIISKEQLINNLIEHFKKWSPFIKKHGLILLELHTIDPELAKKFLNDTLAPAYDTTHGYSDQYLIEHSVFLNCLKKSNITIENQNCILFPNNERPTVSINYLK